MTLDPPREAGPDSLSDAFREHYGFVRRCASRLGVPRAALDDAVQDVFVVLHRRRDALRLGASPRALLYAITRRVAKSHRAKSARPALRLAPPHPDDGGMQRWEAAETVRRFLAKLDPQKRDVFVLAELEGMAAAEIAEALGGVNVNTIYTRLRAARIEFKRAVAIHQAQQKGVRRGRRR